MIFIFLFCTTLTSDMVEALFSDLGGNYFLPLLVNQSHCRLTLISSFGQRSLHCQRRLVGVKWRGCSLLSIDEEIDSNHNTSEYQSKQVEEVFWDL
nr:hypothetical protein CFP56_46849 [Quercus suber]